MKVAFCALALSAGHFVPALSFIITSAPHIQTSTPYIQTSTHVCGARRSGICRSMTDPDNTRAKLDADSDYAKKVLAEKQAEYLQKQRAEAAAAAKQGRSSTKVTPLSELPFVSYITEDGMMSQSGQTPAVKASVYAVYDEKKTLMFVGVSRSVQQSLRMQLGRCPELTYYFKVQHITTPSRTLLELIKEEWIAENGVVPPGNDNGPNQARWEAPLNVMSLMTEADIADVEEARQKGRESGAIKKVARRFEAQKVEVLEGRGMRENLRFDPKLKGQGLLDFYTAPAAGPDSGVPDSKPAKK